MFSTRRKTTIQEGSNKFSNVGDFQCKQRATCKGRTCPQSCFIFPSWHFLNYSKQNIYVTGCKFLRRSTAGVTVPSTSLVTSAYFSRQTIKENECTCISVNKHTHALICSYQPLCRNVFLSTSL